MSDYTQSEDFSVKDSLATGNPEKVIKGADIDSELALIATAIATKYDTDNLASQAQAQAGTDNTALMTPLRTEQWSATWAAENAGIVGDLHALSDPGADRLLMWDDSAGETVLTAAIADSFLSANVPLIDAENVFTAGVNKFSASVVNLQLQDTGSSADEGIWALRASPATLQIGRTVSDAGAGAENAITISRSTTEITEVAFEGDSVTSNGSEILTEADEGSGNGIDADTVDGIEAAALRDATINGQNGNYTLVLGDSGKTIFKGSGGAGETITIPANGSVAFPTGTMVTFVNTGGGDLSIAITSDTMFLAGTSSTGTRTLSSPGVATALKITSTAWVISGSGLS